MSSLGVRRTLYTSASFLHFFLFIFRIGFAIARRLGEDGAKVVVSSRKQQNVDKAVKALQKENLDVCGVVCHVGKKEDRSNLIQKVS